MPDTSRYEYPGAGRLVRLHERHLSTFVELWKQASARSLALPSDAGEAYRSPAHLLHHVLGCARSYLAWSCEVLSLPPLPLAPLASVDELDARVDHEVAVVVDAWRDPLAAVPEPAFHIVHPSRWGVGYCVDAMLEHAVMHVIRHSHQLEDLLAPPRST